MPAATKINFGPFCLDFERRELSRTGTVIPLGHRAIDVLCALVAAKGALVTKDDLLRSVWPGFTVEENNLQVQISAVRKALHSGDGAEGYVVTISGRGYRFVGLPSSGDVAAAESRHGALDKPSIIVLPFDNLSGDPEQQYFSDGIAEDIITDLSKVSTLNVLSRNTTFTFKGRAVDIGQIAQRLKVGYVVEGSVRKAGRRVRITAQLIDAGKDIHVWGERYDRDLKDIFALQDEIAQAIVAALKIRLLPAEKKAIESRSTQDPEAYQLYLQGRYYRTQQGARNLEIAVRFCRRALEIDPDYARAWALVALCQAGLHFRGRSEEPGLSAAEKALALDPTLAEAYTARGRALAEMGRFDEALAAHEESLRLEPDSFEVQVNVGVTCLYLGRYEDAIEHSERAAQLLEADYWALCIAADCYRLLGRHDELSAAARRALERAEREIALHPDNARAMAIGAIVLAHLAEKERAKEWAARALTIEPDDVMDHHNIACAFAQMGELDQAIDLLETCVRRVPPKHLTWITREPDLMPLHGHPRYQALIAREEVRLAATTTGQASEAG